MAVVTLAKIKFGQLDCPKSSFLALPTDPHLVTVGRAQVTDCNLSWRPQFWEARNNFCDCSYANEKQL